MKITIGENVWVRAGTRDDYVGKLVSIDGPFTVTLDSAAWVAESGRFSVFMRDGRADSMEIEPMGDGLTLNNISAIKPWPHALFKEAI